MTRKKKDAQPALTNWQRRALQDLRAQAKDQPELLEVGDQTRDDGNLWVQFTLTTRDLPTPTADGLTFKAHEDFVLALGPLDERPPTVLLPHHRFIGTPHVLSGFYLCLYLDESREWNPKVGINGYDGVLHRLWDWMTKATQNDFNPDTALYHAVGGVPHVTPGSQTIVVRDLPTPHGRVVSAFLNRRTINRLDLADEPAAKNGTEHIPVFYADTDMPIGAGHHVLGELLTLVRHPRPFGTECYIKPARPERRVQLPSTYEQARVAARLYACGLWSAPYRFASQASPYLTTPESALFTSLIASASRNPDGTPQRLFLAVPHPNGGPRHLLALQLAPELADELRDAARSKSTPLIEYAPERLNGLAPIQWCFVSDERAAVTTRRDTARPVAALYEKIVVILGCGGLGSWAAEFVVRAGAARVILSDHGRVTGGLLVRQNYVEADIGSAKVVGLSERLHAISDNVVIEVAGTLTTAELTQLASRSDLIIDATISLKMSNQLDIVAGNPKRRAFIAQIATDARTGTLGYATINPPGSAITMTEMDRRLRDAVFANGALERYRYFWEEPAPGDELVPTRGCSAPTFHGSAADLAALSGGLTTLIAKHLANSAQGAHLIALPHSDVQPSHQYVPC